jgi:hypothetical protein
MNFKDIQELVRSLPIEQKAKLIEEEIKTIGLNIDRGNHTTTAEIVFQMCGVRDLQVDEILQVLAEKVRQQN